MIYLLVRSELDMQFGCECHAALCADYRSPGRTASDAGRGGMVPQRGTSSLWVSASSTPTASTRILASAATSDAGVGQTSFVAVLLSLVVMSLIAVVVLAVVFVVVVRRRRVKRVTTSSVASLDLKQPADDTQRNSTRATTFKMSCASISVHGWGGTQWPINPPHYCPLIHLHSFPHFPPERCKVSQQVWNRVMN